MARTNKHISWYCTATLSEALSVSYFDSSKHILALSSLDDDLEKGIQRGIHFGVYSKHMIDALERSAQACHTPAYVHIEIETGMMRLGIHADDVYDIVAYILKTSHVKLAGLFTHLSDTSNPDPSYSLQQIKQFNIVLKKLRAHNVPLYYTHAFASSGSYIPTDTRYSFVRAGALSYGLWKNEHGRHALYKDLCLKPVATWKSRILDIRTVPAHSYIGYNCSYKTSRELKIAVIGVGYADGYPRALSNKGYVIINNHKAPIIGIISMNITTVDVTHIPDIHIDQEVFLLGNYDGIHSYNIAQYAHTISNEIISRISPCITRIIV
jgi:alanine racemase